MTVDVRTAKRDPNERRRTHTRERCGERSLLDAVA
jgi:hypothetical protein